jgi:hypothetical protein
MGKLVCASVVVRVVRFRVAARPHNQVIGLGTHATHLYSHRRSLRRLDIKRLRLTFLGFVAVTSNSSN